ncbi:MAG: protein-L-isoaspartate(D-aspartate) O-methyltransferase [Desulfobulbaceae bacterium]|nr:protein-L-isoaspartate(D-aspartate) O-methyltransferase [Desulfobulbaceae bacterium]
MQKINIQMQGMLKTIENECRYTGGLTGVYSLHQPVLTAMATVEREQFVPDEMKPYAYDNTPLPIGNGQTISQPFIVALMTDLLELTPNDVILEIGAGSGYQAAIISKLAKKIYTIEMIAPLAAQATKRLADLGYDNVTVVNGDGSDGYAAQAPYDAIIVTAAAPRIPPALIDQLKPLGRLVIPVGPPNLPQELLLVKKSMSGKIIKQKILSVAFVPFTGKISGKSPS